MAGHYRFKVRANNISISTAPRRRKLVNLLKRIAFSAAECVGGTPIPLRHTHNTVHMNGYVGEFVPEVLRDTTGHGATMTRRY